MKRIIATIVLAGIMLAACEKAPMVEEQPLSDSISLTADGLRPVLKELYDATGGPDWKVQPNWMEEEDLNKWTQFFYNANEGCITLWLGELGLKNTLPVSLASLPLEILDLSGNELSGELPSNLGANGLLEMLLLHDNDFTGNLPTSLASSPMKYLSVSGNRFSGEIPPAIKAMKNYRDFESNLGPQQEGYGFTGTESVDPNEEDVNILRAFHDCQSDIFAREIGWSSTDPENWKGVYWGGDGRCRGLDLKSNKLEGTRDLLKKLTTLNYLDFHNCSIEEALDLSALKELIYLDLGSNRMYALPEGLEQLSHLQMLDLSYNFIKAEIPASLNKLSDLRALYLYNNLFYGQVPVLDQLKKLRLISIEDNSKLAIQPLPEWIGNCPDMMAINLTNGPFSGTIPESWKYLKNVRELDLSNNLLSGEIQHVFEGWKNCKILDLSDNQFSGNLPEFSEGNIYKNVFLAQNKFTGTIPESWTVLKKCERINLNNNELTGSIPASFIELENLSVLDVELNQMAGYMPKSLKKHPHISAWAYSDQKNGKLFFPNTSLTSVRPMSSATGLDYKKATREQTAEEYKAALRAELFPAK